jgi:hypothetical protein
VGKASPFSGRAGKTPAARAFDAGGASAYGRAAVRSPLATLVCCALALAAVIAPAGDAAKRKEKPRKVTVVLKPGSTATLDFGMGIVRTVPLTGTLRGRTTAPIDLTKNDFTIKLTRGAIAVGGADVFADPNCATRPLVSVSPRTRVLPGARHGLLAVVDLLHARLRSKAQVVVRTVALVPGGSACEAGQVPTGYADTPLTLKLGADISSGQLRGVKLASPAPQTVSIKACVTPGDPAKPCTGTPVGYQVALSTSLVLDAIFTKG